MGLEGRQPHLHLNNVYIGEFCDLVDIQDLGFAQLYHKFYLDYYFGDNLPNIW